MEEGEILPSSDGEEKRVEPRRNRLKSDDSPDRQRSSTSAYRKHRESESRRHDQSRRHRRRSEDSDWSSEDGKSSRHRRDSRRRRRSSSMDRRVSAEEKRPRLNSNQQKEKEQEAPKDTVKAAVVSSSDEELEVFVEEEDEEALIVARRRRRMELMEKLKSAITTESQEQKEVTEGVHVEETEEPLTARSFPVETPPEMVLESSGIIAPDSTVAQAEIGAAEFDPDHDTIGVEDERKHQEAVLAKISRHAHEHLYDDTANDETIQAKPVLPNTQQKQAVEDDMFAEEDDMFALEPVAPSSKRLKTVADQKGQVLGLQPIIRTQNQLSSLADQWDDAEGYYQIVIGELMNNRYQVFSKLGRGVFASVVRAKDLQSPEERVIAIKIIRNNDVMMKAGQKEISMLAKLRDADPEDKRHVVRMIAHFEYRHHLCIVFENLSMNLREVLRKFGHKKGLNIRAVRVYAHHLFQALYLLKKCNIIHADIKPDNMLVNEAKTQLKLADLGSASDAQENDITPYLVSRFYRAPEIMLGLPYDFAIDIWSVACTLFELYTGKILFPGRSNNHMLKLMMDLKGRFPYKNLKRGKFATQHFEIGDTGDASVQFLETVTDKITNQETTRKHIVPLKPDRDLRSRLLSEAEYKRIMGLPSADEELKLVTAFVDLLDKCLILNPERRLTVREALSHPFIVGKY